MKISRCPFHVKQGVVDAQGNLILSDICGVKAASGCACSYAPFEKDPFKVCPFFINQTKGSDRQMLVPKSDIEYMMDPGHSENFSEIDLL